ncbi:MAG: sulfite exporter TauE/SafE family protein [Phormidesmis sp. RL_2_1]|nr:sulfite exporter TauE/SafE family protein [Phormidesmis sp. RL_2_1]
MDLAIPLVLLMCLLSSGVLWIYYRDSFRWQAIAPLVLSALVAIPLGLVGLHYVPEAIARKVLGGLIVLYVAYDFLRLMMPVLSLPTLDSPRWAYVFGGVSGFLTGAFTTGGPPLVMYANSQQWSPEEFKGNLPGVYVMALTFALSGHYVEGHLTPELWQLAIYTTPAFAVGMGLGIGLARKIDAVGFKRMVLFLLGAIGLRLLW